MDNELHTEESFYTLLSSRVNASIEEFGEEAFLKSPSDCKFKATKLSNILKSLGKESTLLILDKLSNGSH